MSATSQQPQFVFIKAPATGSNSCSFAQTQPILLNKLNALHAAGQGVPSIDFRSQNALVVTTADASAMPLAMGPAEANPLTLLLTFNRKAQATNSGIFVFAIDAGYAAKFNGCRVQYAAPTRRAQSSVTIK